MLPTSPATHPLQVSYGRVTSSSQACQRRSTFSAAWYVRATALSALVTSAQGKKLFFVTNNSTKSRKGYLNKFTSLGLSITAVRDANDIHCNQPLT